MTKSKEEILENNCRDMLHFDVVQYEVAALISMDEYARQQAMKFAEFLHPDSDGNNWVMYDGQDRWINLKNDEVKSTSQLYDIFQKETQKPQP